MQLPSSIEKIKKAAMDCTGRCFDSFVASDSGAKHDRVRTDRNVIECIYSISCLSINLVCQH